MGRALFLALLCATAPAAADPDWSPVDRRGWPRGKSMEDLRGLPRCLPGEALPGAGEVIPCRPRVERGRLQWAFGLDWTTGIVASDAPVTGGAQALGVQLDFGLSRALALGVRYELAGDGVTTMDGAVADEAANHFLAQARARLFTDEIDRDEIDLTLGGGWDLAPRALGGGAPIARAAIGRQVGAYIDDQNALTMGIELAWEHTFESMPVDAILASARFGFEVHIREPKNASTLDAIAPTRWGAAADVYVGPWLGFGYAYGLSLAGPLSLVATGSTQLGLTKDLKEHGLEGAEWGLGAGPRVDAGPIGVQVEGGAVWISRAPWHLVRPMVDAEVDLPLAVGCRRGIAIGVRGRADFADNTIDELSGSLVLRFGGGGGLVHAHGDCRPVEIARMPSPPVPVADVPTETETVTVGTGQLPTVDVDAHVGVTAPPPAPTTIDVTLGAALLGGAVQVSIDPRLLPLDQLREGHVTVELRGPGGSIDDYERALRAELDRDQVNVAGWQRTDAGGTTMHAIFTITP